MIIKEKQESEILVTYQFCLSKISYSYYFLPLLPSAKTPDNKTRLHKRLTKSFSMCCASCWLHHLIMLKKFFFFSGRSFGKKRKKKKRHCKVRAPLASSFSSFSYFVIQRNLAKSISAYLHAVYQTGRLTWCFCVCTLQFYFPLCW